MELLTPALACVATFFATFVLVRSLMNAPVRGIFSDKPMGRWFAAAFSVVVISFMFGYGIQPGPWVIAWLASALLGAAVTVAGTLYDRRGSRETPGNG